MEILGIQIDPPFLKVARIQKKKGVIKILDLNTFPLSTSTTFANVKPLYMKNFNGKAVSGLSSKNFLVRPLELKIGKTRHLEKALAFQAESTSHFDPADILTVPYIKKKDKKTTEALLFTVPRDALKAHLSDLEPLQIDPDRIGANPSAACSFIHWKFPHLQDAFIIDFGSSEWSCTWMEQGILKKSHSIPGGTEILYKALLEDRKKILLPKEIEGAAKQLDLSHFKAHLYPHLAEKLQEFGYQVTKAIYSFQRETGAKPVLFTGNSDAFVRLKETILENLEAAPHTEQLSLEEQKYAVAIGHALEETSKNPLQLRVEEFFPIKNWVKLGKAAVTLTALSLILSITIFGIAKWGLLNRNEALQANLSQALNDWELPQKKKMSTEEWITAIESYNKEYPYIPLAPKVSHVLSWITSNPLFAAFSKEGDPISIQSLRYQLEKYPKIGATKEPYLAKVEMEFKFQSQIHARKFHEALLKGDDLVDAAQEISWDALNDGYRTSFYLKNRGPNGL